MERDFDRLCRLILQQNGQKNDQQNTQQNGQSDDYEEALDFSSKRENTDVNQDEKTQAKLSELSSICATLKYQKFLKLIVKFIGSLSKMDDTAFMNTAKYLDSDTRENLKSLVSAFTSSCKSKVNKLADSIDVNQLLKKINLLKNS